MSAGSNGTALEPVAPTVPGIHRRLLSVMADAGVVEKKKKSGVPYSFQGIDDVEGALRPALVAHGVFVEISTESMARETACTTNGKEVQVSLCRLAITFVNADEPSDRVGPLYFDGSGQDHSDKADGKALAYALKGAYLSIFHLRGKPDNEDDEIDTQPGTRQPRGQASQPRATNGKAAAPSAPRYVPKAEAWKHIQTAMAGRRVTLDDLKSRMAHAQLDADKLTPAEVDALVRWARSQPIATPAKTDPPIELIPQGDLTIIAQRLAATQGELGAMRTLEDIAEQCEVEEFTSWPANRWSDLLDELAPLLTQDDLEEVRGRLAP